MKPTKILFAVLAMSAAVLAPLAHAQKEGGPGGGKRGGDFLKVMTENLQLTDAQIAKIKPILASEREALAALRDNTSLDGPARMARMREIRESYRAQIRAELTPEQQAKLDAMRPMGGPGGKGRGKDRKERGGN